MELGNSNGYEQSEQGASQALVAPSAFGLAMYLLICTAAATWLMSVLISDQVVAMTVTVVLAIVGMWAWALWFRLRAISRAVRAGKSGRSSRAQDH